MKQFSLKNFTFADRKIVPTAHGLVELISVDKAIVYIYIYVGVGGRGRFTVRFTAAAATRLLALVFLLIIYLSTNGRF